jgi:hypothetical protein
MTWEALKTDSGLIGLYLLLASPFSVVTASIPGSNVNYFLETSAAASLAMALIWPVYEAMPGMRGLLWYRFLMVAIIAGALYKGIPSVHGEYYKWQSLGYYREMVTRLRQYVPEGEPCFTVYPELATAAGRTYYFNSDSPYDGRSPQLAAVKSRVFASGVLAAAVTHSPVSPPGYHRVPISHAVPTQVYPVFLHVRNNR